MRLHLLQSPTLTTLPPLSLYIHMPWCIRKCPYCDFNSHTLKAELNEANYIQALLTDLEQELPHIWGRPIETIFIGGGTPSLFSAESIDQLLSGIRARIRLQPEAEITLEANPGTFEQEKFQGYRQAGINRLSLGIQSFQSHHLQALGRIHSQEEAKAALATACQIFPRVNTDLMYALPKQIPEEAAQDIDTAITLGASHISAYHLTLEPNTPFGHTPPPNLPSDDTAIDIEEAVHHTLTTQGFIHYETSAFAKSQQACLHNLNYWQFGDYLGIGAGAHGKISYPSHIERTTRSRHPKDYLAAMQSQPSAAIERKPIAPESLPFEFMLGALRLLNGVPAHYFQERTGLPLAAIAPQLAKASAKGLLSDNPQHLAPSTKGSRFLNDLLELFL